MKLLVDSVLFLGRSLRSTARNPVWIAVGLFQPMLYLLLFAPLLTSLGAVAGFPGGGAFVVFTPGLLIMVALFGTAYVGFGMISEVRFGLIERFLVTPANRLAFLLGYILRDLIVLLVQSLLLMGLAAALGMRASIFGAVAALGLVLLTGLWFSAGSYALGLTLRNENSLSSVLQFTTLPLLLLSGITLPLSLAPKAIRAIAGASPLSYTVTAARSLFRGTTDRALAVSLIYLAILAVTSLFWAYRALQNSSR